MKVIKSEGYQEAMELLVEPYLNACSQELWFDSAESEKIHCMYYQAENPRGVVLISHGFTESAEKYLEVIYYLLKENYHVYITEHCGHGYSYRLCQDLSMVHVDDYRRYVDDFVYVAQYIKSQHSYPLFLYAHSMGSAIGLLAAAKEPDLFHKIILNSPMIRPNVGKLPWNLVKVITAGACAIGKGSSYIPGHHSYKEIEKFEESCSVSKERFEYYNLKKSKEQAYQTSGASYRWMHQITKVYKALLCKAYKRISCPVILFQAGEDTVVSLDCQKKFIKKIYQYGNQNVKLIRIPDVKHEIYNSKDETLDKYWKYVFLFLSE